MIGLIEFYDYVKKEVIKRGFKSEIDFVESRRFEDVDSKRLLLEYVYVVLNSGMKNKVAEMLFKQYMEHGTKVVRHEGKRKAIIQAQLHYRWWFKNLKVCGTVDERLDYLDSLPWIGPITKYHLARNLGIDVAKPDRHLQRIADCFKYYDVQKMCNTISIQTGERIGTIDLVLWRGMEMTSGSILDGWSV